MFMKIYYQWQVSFKVWSVYPLYQSNQKVLVIDLHYRLSESLSLNNKPRNLTHFLGVSLSVIQNLGSIDPWACYYDNTLNTLFFDVLQICNTVYKLSIIYLKFFQKCVIWYLK